MNTKVKLVILFKNTLKIGGLTFFFEESGDGNPGGLLPHLGGDFLRLFFFVHVIIFRLIHLFTVFNSKCLNLSDRRLPCRLYLFCKFQGLHKRRVRNIQVSYCKTRKLKLLWSSLSRVFPSETHSAEEWLLVFYAC